MPNNNMKNPSKIGVSNNKPILYDYPKYSLSYKTRGAILGKPNERSIDIRNDILYASADVLLMTVIHLLVLYIEKNYNLPYKTYDETYLSRFLKGLVWNFALMFLIVAFIGLSGKTIRGYRTIIFVSVNILKFILFKILIEPIDIGL